MNVTWKPVLLNVPPPRSRPRRGRPAGKDRRSAAARTGRRVVRPVRDRRRGVAVVRDRERVVRAAVVRLLDRGEAAAAAEVDDLRARHVEAGRGAAVGEREAGRGEARDRDGAGEAGDRVDRVLEVRRVVGLDRAADDCRVVAADPDLERRAVRRRAAARVGEAGGRVLEGERARCPSPSRSPRCRCSPRRRRPRSRRCRRRSGREPPPSARSRCCRTRSGPERSA